MTDNTAITSQINQITEPTQTRSFGYDLVNRLTGVTNPGGTNESYNFDDVGNRTSSHRSASYGYQPFNKVVSTATANYNYDANGNMVSKLDSTGNWIYGWDHENRMISARKQNKTVRYQYDALGRRVSRHGKAVGVNAKYTYDGLDVVMDDTNEGIVKYQNGLGIDNKLKMVSNGNAKYFLQDHLGSTIGLTDASGNVSSSASYDSFGNSTNNLSTRYQYTGREKDEFTGLYFYRARWYDANLGRFISEDPIGFNGGDINIYGYVRNKPLNFKDPDGKNPLLVVAVVGGILLVEGVTNLVLSHLAYTGYANLGVDPYGRKRHCWVNCASTRLHLGNPVPIMLAGYVKEAVNLYQDSNLWDDSIQDINANTRGQSLAYIFWRSCESLCNECQPEQ